MWKNILHVQEKKTLLKVSTGHTAPNTYNQNLQQTTAYYVTIHFNIKQEIKTIHGTHSLSTY